MKFWMKALLCGITAASLAACGGDDDGAAAPPPAASAGGTVSASALTGISANLESAAGFAIDGVDAGVYGDFTFFPPAAFSGLESPLAATPMVACSTGTAVYSGSAKTLTYTNCKVGDNTLNGVVKVVGATDVYTVTFDFDASNPLKITGSGSDGKTVTLTYSGNQVVSNLQGSYPDYTGAKIVMNATVKIGTASTVKFTNFAVTYGPGGTNIERTTVDGKYSTSIKLSDFGIPATAGVPDTIDMEFTITTPTPVDFNYVTNQDVAGVIRFAGMGFTIEIDYGAKKARLTVTGGTTQEFPL